MSLKAALVVAIGGRDLDGDVRMAMMGIEAKAR